MFVFTEQLQFISAKQAVCLNALMDLMGSRISAAKNISAWSSLQSDPSWEVFCAVTLQRLSLFIAPHLSMS